MSERAYTVAQINQLRDVCREKVIWGSYGGPDLEPGETTVMSRGFAPGDVERDTTELVRMHMLAGHTAADLLASERGVSEGWREVRARVTGSGESGVEG